MPAPTQVEYRRPAAMLRFLTIRGGTVAFSCFNIWTPMKAIIRTPNRTRRATIRQLFQAYVDPPHCKARRRQTTPGMKKNVPTGSSFSIFSRTVRPEFAGAGALRMKAMMMSVTAPMGKLMKTMHNSVSGHHQWGCSETYSTTSTRYLR